MILDCIATTSIGDGCVPATMTTLPEARAGATRAYPWDACDVLKVSLRAPVTCPAFKVKHLQQTESRWLRMTDIGRLVSERLCYRAHTPPVVFLDLVDGSLAVSRLCTETRIA